MLSYEEIKKILEAPDVSKPLGLRDRAILELMYAAGVRISELQGLKIDDFDLEGSVIRVFGKGSKERIVPVGVEARDFTKMYLAKVRPNLPAATQSDHLFLSARSTRLSRNALWKIVKRYAARAGIDK